MKHDLSLETAQQLILENISELPAERVSLLQAVGRVMAEEIVAEQDLPSKPQSAVDGYALGDGTAQANTYFTLKGSIFPGNYHPIEICSGQAAGVYTGADLPTGTLSVIMQEKVQANNGTIQILEAVQPGSNIKEAGEDYQLGEGLMGIRTRLTAGHIALLAAYGYEELLVYRQPRVALCSLSKNVVSHKQIPQPGQVRDSNLPFMWALIKQEGGSVVGQLWASELEPQILINCLNHLAFQTDLIILSGGTYAGHRSEAQELLESAGARMIYWGTDIQPGSHNGLALYGSKPVFALSGNPAACAVGFNLFVAPALRYLQGLPALPLQVRARCTNSYNKAARSHRLVRGWAQLGPQGWLVTVLPGQKPSMLKSLLGCNALISLPPGHSPLEKDSEVTILLLSAGEGQYT